MVLVVVVSITMIPLLIMLQQPIATVPESPAARSIFLVDSADAPDKRLLSGIELLEYPHKTVQTIIDCTDCDSSQQQEHNWEVDFLDILPGRSGLCKYFRTTRFDLCSRDTNHARALVFF